MPSLGERWAQRFRVRRDAVAPTRSASREEERIRELHVTLVLAWFSFGTAVLLTAAAVLTGVPWWAPVGVAASATSFALAHRRARRRGRPTT